MTQVEKVRIDIDTSKYAKAKSAAGSPSFHNGDVVATSLAGLHLSSIYVITAQILSIPQAELEAKYEHLNVGQQRMNLGNRIRGAVQRLNKAAEGEGGGLSGDVVLATLAEPHQFALAESIKAQEAEAEKAAAEKAAEKAAKAAAKEEAKAAKAAAKEAAKAAKEEEAA